MKMDLRLLRYFLTVAEELHVTRAATRLGIQQAPLSQQLKLLEREIGAQLFRRKSRGIELTDAGAALQQEMTRVYADFDHAIAITRRIARGEQGSIRVGLTSSACFHPFPSHAIRQLRRSHPQVDVRFEQSSSLALIERIQAGLIDVGFIRSVAVELPGIEISPLFEEPMIVALPPGHRLRRDRSATGLALATLANETFIGYPRALSIGLMDQVIAACMASGFHPNVGHEATQIVSTLNLVAAGMGIAVVPASMRRLRLVDLSYRSLSGALQPVAQLNIAVQSKPSPASAIFVQEVRGAAASFIKTDALAG